LGKTAIAVALLKNDFLINVTSFFRDIEAFKVLKEEIGKSLEEKPEGSQIRAWIPACSTGEEAYSIAMIIMECIRESGRYYDMQIFGTDLDSDAIAFARAGTYSAAILSDVGEVRLKTVGLFA
jgi:two-component system CheB/CheR fusion protein